MASLDHNGLKIQVVNWSGKSGYKFPFYSYIESMMARVFRIINDERQNNFRLGIFLVLPECSVLDGRQEDLLMMARET